MGRGGAVTGVIRSGQGTEAMSSRLGLAAGLATGTLPPLVQPVRSTAVMVAVPTAWCSLALALLLALHEGEPPPSLTSYSSRPLRVCL